MKPNLAIVLVAVAAGALGAIASLMLSDSPLLLRSEWGQRVATWWMTTTASPPPAQLPIPRRGELLPSLRLRSVDGRTMSLPSASAGRPLLINLWASWCAPCVREMPALQRFYAQQGANGVQVVGIALDDVDAVRGFLQRTRIGYPVLLDTPGPADAGVRLGNPKGVLPYSVLVSADGRLLKQHLGPLADDQIAEWAQP